jgi:2-C-methyl-D-erythritol 4-phosphate cytidylyltransferase / 2-C-methyl-D-erythritol 2,4-cyclodiphosphate synthase
MAETVALIVAAGRGERAAITGTNGEFPKQYWDLAGQPVLRYAVSAFLDQLPGDSIFVVIRPEHQALYRSAVADLIGSDPVSGGPARQDSVRLGLEAIAARRSPEKVLIHDAARPLVSRAVIQRVIKGLDTADAVAPMIRISDTLRRRLDSGFELHPRDDLFRTQTPQGFRFSTVLAAHRRFAGESLTDDIALAERAGIPVLAVEGEEMNLKLTTAGDFETAERLARPALSDIRTGSGFDVHRFTRGDHIWLCGIRVPHEFGLEGHSDADAGLHALTDAVLGAIGAGDIGSHFPPSDERWRGAPSQIFLKHAALLVRELGGVIAHCDVTVICERPKISPHREAMKQRIAEVLSISPDRVSVKGTTTEGLGFTGRGEGIAAQAIATIRLPVR